MLAVQNNCKIQMSEQQKIYDDNWINNIKYKDISSSWAKDVLNDIEGYGGVHLSKIREWFSKFPFGSPVQSNHMKKRLESHITEDYLGAVNELFWYNLVRLHEWDLEALSEKKSAPDFNVTSPACFYCEITTLNTSQSDRNSFANGTGVPLNHDKEAARILRKTAEEKIEQLRYGYHKQKPSVLVVFDYSTFSGLGTQRPQALADVLLGSSGGLQTMPRELSALLYLERYVKEGKFRLRLSQSAAYHNPSADYPIERDIFSWVIQFPLSEFTEIPQQLSIDLLVE